MKDKTRLIALSNRLPVALHREEGTWRVLPGTGGLVTALAPALRNRGGLWVGWPGTDSRPEIDRLLASASRGAGYELIPVSLTKADIAGYYDGFSNRTAWPLFHDLQSFCTFSPNYWYSYLTVNRKFAEKTLACSSEDDYIWIHDYHLMGVASAIRDMGQRRRTGFFLHIPFPPLDIFVKLPWRAQVLQFLLEHDLVGFQTLGDRRNFLECLQRLLPGIRTRGRGPVVTVQHEGGEVRVGAFPISIDYDGFLGRAASPEVEGSYHAIKDAFSGKKIIFGLDRMDYTKGLPERLRGFRNALVRYPDLRGRVTLVQNLVPSRRSLKEYKILKARIERLVSEINGEFANMEWTPIQYHFRTLTDIELLSYYRAADIALITPLKDGMNLVAKEYCTCTIRNEGVLILSEFAGAAAQFQNQALLVNPYDSEGTADAIYQAFTMDRSEKRRRMRKMRESVRRQNIYWWVNSFLQAAFARHLEDFPPVDEYIPDMNVEAP